MRFVTDDRAWRVDVIHLSCTGTGHDGEWYRVSYFSLFQANVRTVQELEQFFPLHTLTQVS
jgi:hypothetical protein